MMKTAIAQCILAMLVAFVLGLPVLSHAEIDMSTAVGVWLFDEGSGDTSQDWSGVGPDVTLVKSPEWVPGQFGMGVKFNGKDNCGETGESLLENLEHFTITAWINTDGAAGSRNDPG